jgi:hypothetical protein
MLSHVLHDITSSNLGITQNLPLGCAVAPTQIPSSKVPLLAVLTPEDNNSGLAPSLNSSSVALSSVPLQVAEFLFKIYITRIIRQYPTFTLEEVVGSFNRIPHREQIHKLLDIPQVDDCIRDKFTSLVMTISFSTAA